MGLNLLYSVLFQGLLLWLTGQSFAQTSQTNINLGSGALEVRLLYQGRPIRETLAETAVVVSAPNLFFRNLDDNTNLISWTLPVTNSLMRIVYTSSVFINEGVPNLVPPVPIHIEAGKTNVVTLDLCPPLGLLTGRVLLNGKPVSASMSFRDLPGNELLSTSSDENGFFRVLLPAGQGLGQVNLVQGQGAFAYTVKGCQTNTMADINVGSGALEVHLLYQGRPIQETLAESAVAVSAPQLFFRNLSENTNLISWTLPVTNSVMRILYTRDVFTTAGVPNLLPPVPFRIEAGKTNVVTLDLCPPLGLLTGRIFLNGKPVSASMTFRDLLGNELLSTSSDESGLFRVLLPSGQGEGQVNLVQGQGAFAYTVNACQTNQLADINLSSGALEVRLLYQGRPIRETLAETAVVVSAPRLFLSNLHENTNLISQTLPVTNTEMRIVYTSGVFISEDLPDLLPPVPIRIEAGKTNVVTLELCPPLGLLIGRVVLNGNPVSATMSFRDLRGSGFLSTSSDASGLFRVLLPAGVGQGQVNLVQGQGAFTYSVVACQTNELGDLTEPPQPPLVSLVSPTEGSVFVSSARIPLAATATTTNGTVTKVEFFQGDLSLGSVTKSPYGLAWSNAPPGAHRLSARATDSIGLVGTSSPVHITVLFPNAPPNLSLITNQTTFEDTSTPAIAFTLSDAETPAASLVVSATSSNPSLLPAVGIALGGSGANRTLTLTPARDQSGVATLSVVVKDGGGLTATNRFELTVIPVNDPPTVSLTSPKEGESFGFGTNVLLTATVNDIDSPVSKVEFFDGSTKLGEDLTAPYAMTWSDGSIGDHTLTAKVTDREGAATISTAVHIVIVRVHTVPIGDFMIIRNFAAPEIDRLAEYLEHPELKIFDPTDNTSRKPVITVVDQEGLEFSDLTGFRLIIWDDLGQAEQGIRDRDVALLWEAWKFGIPIYFIGEGLALANVPLSEVARRQWTEMVGLVPGGPVVKPGTVTALDPVDRVNELFRGVLSDTVEVADFSYPRSVTPGEFAGSGEIRASMGEAPMLIRHPDFAVEKTGDVRRLVQGFLATSGEAASVEERRKLFLNGVVWLLGGECDAFIVSLICPDFIGDPSFETCRPFKLSATIRNNGECPAGGVTVTNVLAPGLEIVQTVLRTTPEGAETGLVRRDGQTVTYLIGALTHATVVEMETWVVARRAGDYTSTFSALANHRPGAICEQFITVTASGCDCPRLEISRTADHLALTIRSECKVGTILQVSTDLMTWANSRTNSPGVQIETVPIQVSKEDPYQFFRLIFAP